MCVEQGGRQLLVVGDCRRNVSKQEVGHSLIGSTFDVGTI